MKKKKRVRKKMSFTISKGYSNKRISCFKESKGEIPKDEISHKEEASFSFSFCKPVPTPLANISTTFKWKDGLITQTIEQKKLLAKRQRLERSIERQQTKHNDEMVTLTYKSLNLSTQIKQTKLMVKSSKEEVYNTEGKLPVERRNLVRKLKAIETLEKKFEDYKVYSYAFFIFVCEKCEIN